MSTTQVVISGLASITLIYLPASDQNVGWFGWEIFMWIIMPILGLAMAHLTHTFVKK
jgi:phosphate/sulfate permease